MDDQQATHTVRISCPCTGCADNAERIGHPFPLAAFITPQAATVLGITPANANRAKVTHGTIHMAHHPVIGKAQRMAVPVVH